jgi:hypothetical protein
MPLSPLCAAITAIQVSSADITATIDEKICGLPACASNER